MTKSDMKTTESKKDFVEVQIQVRFIFMFIFFK